MRGIKGLSGASALDRSVLVRVFTSICQRLRRRVRRLSKKLFGAEKGEGVEVVPKEGIRPRKVPSGPTEKMVSSKSRRGPGLF